MRDLKRIVLTRFIVSLSMFFIAQAVSAQGTWEEQREERQEKFKEKIREKLIEKKREGLTKQETGVGLGGIDARIPLKWITGNGQEGEGFVYGAGDYGRKLRFGGLERFCEIHVPPGYDRNKPTPVVLNFHGGGGYPSGARYDSGMDSVSDKNGFIVVYPAGTGKLFNDRLLTWNDGRPDKDGKPYTADDVGFVAALLDDLALFFNLDALRIYATGISNGAQFSYTLANKLSDRIAAIAPIAGQRTVDQYFPPPPRPISVMQISGLEDKLAPYYGGIPPKKAGQVTLDFKWTMKSVKEAIQSWVAHNGCVVEPIETKRIGKAVMTRYGQGKDNTEVILWTIEDGGHTWPGGKMFPSEVKAGLGHLNTDISASELIWEFFKKHAARPLALVRPVAEQAKRAEAPSGEDRAKVQYDRPGPHKVKTLEFPDLKDAKRRDRRVPIKALYPESEGGFPLVLMSHGGAGTWDANLYQAEHLARHGYVVFCLEHIDSNNKRVAYYMSRAGGRMTFLEALHRITKDADAMLERPKDVSFAIDQAIVWNESDPRLKGKIDTKKIGMMGHSYGAYTTLVVCGAQPIRDHLIPAQDPPTGLAGDLSDPRVTFGFPMSPQPTGGTYFGDDSYRTINKPLVCLTGPKDDWKTSDGKVMPGERRLEAFKLLPPGEKYFFWLEGADHASFSDGPKADFLPSKARPDAQRISKALMVVSCDYYLKGEKEAAEFLSEAYVNSLCGKVVTKAELMTK